MLTALSLHNYRNLNLETAIGPKLNLIVASNGSGKSNLLESIYFANSGHSFRPLRDISEIIGPTDTFAKATLEYNIPLSIIVSNQNRLTRRFILSDKVRSLSQIIGLYPVILFAPHAVDIASGEPSARRTDLDDYLSMLSQDYRHQLNQYTNLLKNRNALLKQIKDGRTQISDLQFWSDKLIESGIFLVRQRLEFFNDIQSYATEVASQIYDQLDASFEVTYQSKITEDLNDYAGHLQVALTQNWEKEVIVGQTLYGPHKDDYSLNLGNENLRYIGSRGQQRIAVMIWKLAQHQFLLKTKEKDAVILIDDLMSELDEKHRTQIGEYLIKYDHQIIMTSAVENDVPQNLLANANIISLQS